MSESETHTTRTSPLPLPPATVEQLLEQEEARAIQRLASSLHRLEHDVLAAVELRARIRRHPFLATGLGAALGFAAAPLAPRILRWIVTAASGLPHLAARMPVGVACLVLASVRGARARR
jgi:hypothetical protein